MSSLTNKSRLMVVWPLTMAMWLLGLTSGA
jgi:hypothetical protein